MPIPCLKISHEKSELFNLTSKFFILSPKHLYNQISYRLPPSPCPGTQVHIEFLTIAHSVLLHIPTARNSPLSVWNYPLFPQTSPLLCSLSFSSKSAYLTVPLGFYCTESSLFFNWWYMKDLLLEEKRGQNIYLSYDTLCPPLWLECKMWAG